MDSQSSFTFTRSVPGRRILIWLVATLYRVRIVAEYARASIRSDLSLSQIASTTAAYLGSAATEITTHVANLVGYQVQLSNVTKVLSFKGKRADSRMGSGLGLAICEAMLERMKGTITVRSNLGRAQCLQ